MILYHVTHNRFVPSIFRSGLTPAYSEGKRSVTWLCTAGRVLDIIGHVARWHGWCECEMYVILADVHRKLLKGGRKGIYQSDRPIPVKALTRIGSAQSLATKANKQ